MVSLGIVEAHRKEYNLGDRLEGRIKAFVLLFKDYGNDYMAELYKKEKSNETTTISEDFTEQAYQERLMHQKERERQREYHRPPL